MRREDRMMGKKEESYLASLLGEASRRGEASLRGGSWRRRRSKLLPTERRKLAEAEEQAASDWEGSSSLSLNRFLTSLLLFLSLLLQ